MLIIHKLLLKGFLRNFLHTMVGALILFTMMLQLKSH